MPGLLDTDRGPLDSWRTPLDLSLAEGLARARSARWLQRNAILVAALAAVLGAALAMALAALQPWVGLRLAPQGNGVVVRAVVPGSPAEGAGLRTGMRLLALAAPDGGPAVVLEPADVIEDPDLFNRYAEWGRFYERQDRLVQLLAGGPVLLQVLDAGDAQARVLSLRPDAERPLHSLPPAFWFQLLLLALGLLAAGWVIAVYPPQPATQCAALAGLALAVALACAAVFSTRELALPARLFHRLSVLNHFGSIGSLLALAGVMSWFPTVLRGASGRGVALVCGVFGAWAVADALWWLPSPNAASRAMMVAGTALVFVQMARQGYATIGNAPARAAVRALAVPWVLGLSALIGLQEGILLLGGTPPLAQARLYGLTAVAGVGAALALRHVRVFNLDDWAIQALLSWGACIGVLVTYRLLQATQWFSDDLAMVVAVLVFGLAYVPLSSGVWGRSILRRGLPPRDLASGILALGLMVPGERAQLWASLLERTFRVRRLELSTPAPDAPALPGPAVVADGHALWIPPVADLPGVTLWHRDRGGRLFTRGDRRLAQRLSALASQIIQARQAYVRGARDERERIADDLHDDLGAKLLSLVHASERADARAEVARLAREALEEMRLSVRHLKAQPVPAADALADWRAEGVSRLAAAGIEVDWDAQLPDHLLLMPVRTSSQLTRVVREAVSNIIRHSGASHCRVVLHLTDAELQLEVEDNGRGIDPAAVATGQGLHNIERRVRRLGGTHRFATGGLGGTLLMVRVPLEGGGMAPGADR